MKAPAHYRTEVVPYTEAPWAPHLPGFSFRWAWRVVNPDGSVYLTGVSNGSAEEAWVQAEEAASRRFDNNRGVMISRTAISKKSRARTTTRADDRDVAEDGSAPLPNAKG